MKYDKTKALEFLNSSTETNFVIRTEAEEAAYVQNLIQSQLVDAMKPEMRKIHDKYDLDVLTMTGIQKFSDEKSSEYVKRALKTLKENSGDPKTIADLKQKIADLEKNPSGELENVKKTAQAREKELQEKIEALNKQIFEKELAVNFNASMSGMKFKDIPKSVLDAYIKTVREKWTPQSKIIDGKLVYLKEDGTIMRNPVTLEPMSTDDLLKEEMKDVIDVSVQGKGTGTQSPADVSKGADGKLVVNVPFPATVKTKAEGIEILGKAGLVKGTPEFSAAYEKYVKHLPSLA